MTASAGAWYRVGKVNVTNGNQSVVGVDTNWQSDVIAIAIGDFFTLDAKTWYEVIAVNSDTSITLDRGFEGSTGTNKTYAIVRNTSGTILTRIAGQVSVQFNQKQLFLDELRTWLNSDNASEELTDSHGLKQSLKTPLQMVRDHDNKLAELDAIHPYPWAMRKVEFEARRAANNEKFAASGFVHKGRHHISGDADGPEQVIGEGLYTALAETNLLRIGRDNSSTTSLNYGESKEALPVLNIAGVLTKIKNLSENNITLRSSIKLPPSEDGTRTYDSNTGVSVKHATPEIAFASETDTNKVVTTRVDMWGFEFFLREINDSDPFVYDKGLIQSRSTNINGVATVEDNVRPITYFAWYEGDETSRGKGVNWQTASEAQRSVIASDPENNIYFDDATGKFYQWGSRGRSFAGAGQEGWSSIESHSELDLAYSTNSPVKRVIPQGGLDSVSLQLGGGSYYFRGYDYAFPSNVPAGLSLGIFTVGHNSGQTMPEVVGVGGHCHFYVCSTINRLNKGAFHPSFNPHGTARFKNEVNNGGSFWASPSILPPHSILECFSMGTDGVAGKEPTLNSGSVLGGSISYSGRPDGKYYDAIYASGYGGVCRDMRYSAWGLTTEDFMDADLKIKRGDYRGLERMPTTLVTRAIDPEFIGAFNTIRLPVLSERDWEVGDTLHVEASDGLFHQATITGVDTSNDYRVSFTPTITTGNRPATPLVIHQNLSRTVMGDEMLILAVVGHPANILDCSDLAEGWEGTWVAEIPDGTLKDFPLRHRFSSSVLKVVYSDNGGDLWSGSTTSADATTNGLETSLPANALRLWYYNAVTNLTKPVDNQEIHKGLSGIGKLFSSSYYAPTWGGDLGYSLTGELLKGTLSTDIYRHYSLDTIGIRPTGELDKSTTERLSTHPELTLSSTYQSSGFKALNYNVVKGQQGFINYAYTELKYDVDWGDDRKIHIANNQATMLDTNGNTVKVGTAQIVEPLGWIKNDK
ncbi:MAG: hypothetical protein ACKVH6_00260 [Enterobacterales bacterium]